MRKNKRSTTLLLLGIFACIVLIFFTHSFAPTTIFPLQIVSIPAHIPFFILFFLTLFGIGGFLLKSPLQGILAGFFGVFFLLLRMLGFTHWFFTVVLVLLFAVIEFMFLQKN